MSQYVIVFRNGSAVTSKPIDRFGYLFTMLEDEHDEATKEVVERYRKACSTPIVDFSGEQMDALRVELDAALDANARRLGIELRTKQWFAKDTIGWALLEAAGTRWRTLGTNPRRRDFRRHRRAVRALKALESGNSWFRAFNRKERTENMAFRVDGVWWAQWATLPRWRQMLMAKAVGDEKRALNGTTCDRDAHGNPIEKVAAE